ncbi:hypothetical protein PanNE5_22180 [Pandoraea sp. NE5]|nr:hypothetical protein PanNE5_22180 [Pandoraea sp. NE5]
MSDRRRRGGGVTGAKLAAVPEDSLAGKEDIGKDDSLDDMSASVLDGKITDTTIQDDASLRAGAQPDARLRSGMPLIPRVYPVVEIGSFPLR